MSRRAEATPLSRGGGGMIGEGRRSLSRGAERANRWRALPRWVDGLWKTLPLVLLLGGMGGGTVWLWRSGLPQAAVGRVEDIGVNLAALLGYRVKEIWVTGRSGSEKDDLLAAVGLRRGDPIFRVSLPEAKARLEKLPWIASAVLERRLPDTLFVRVVEREPMALWQNDRRLVLIDRAGKILAEQGVERFAQLPIVVGQGAEQQAPALLNHLAENPELAAHVGAAVLVAGRRWDLRLDNGVNVRLPETDYPGALRRLGEILRTEPLLERNIVTIDLRLSDRLIFQSGPSPTPPVSPLPKRRTGSEKT